MNNKGNHGIADIYLADMPPPLELITLCEAAIVAANMHVVSFVRHDFAPEGLTAVWILSESHFTIHTYPEHKYISVDCYTCGNEGNPAAAIEKLRELLGTHSATMQYFKRG